MRHIQRPDGKMAGSIGLGRDVTPTPSPVVEPALSTNPIADYQQLLGLVDRVRADDWLRRMNGLPDVQVRPAGPPPDRLNATWELVCVGCEEKRCSCPRTHQVRPNNLLGVGQRLACCCYPRVTTQAQAEAVLAQHLPGWSSFLPYRGHTKLTWTLSCNACGFTDSLTINQIRSATRRPACFCEGNDLSARFLRHCDEHLDVYVPQVLLLRADEPVPATCRTCGDQITLRPDLVLAGKPQPCSCTAGPRRGKRPLTDEQARARVLARFPNTTFLEPYPGDMATSWNMRCGDCERDCRPRLNAALTQSTLGCGCMAKGRNRHDPDVQSAALAGAHPGYSFTHLDGDGGSARWQVTCSEGHVTENNAQRLKTVKVACGECGTRHGFDPSQTGYLYVISGRVDGRSVTKFGITNYPEDRLRTHAKTGMGKVLLMVEFGRGQDAADLEAACKRMRGQWSIPSATEEGVKFDGSTESVFTDDPDARAFVQHLLEHVKSTAGPADPGVALAA
ncbi:MAG: hypothetical protein QG597_1349 [Actinomycetota bacterium]|nr:hypothetical protein [Actinomycetota bacterium]